MEENTQNLMNFGNFFNIFDFYLVQVVKIHIKSRACSGKDLGFVGSIFNIEATRAANQDPDDPIKRHLRLKVNYHPEAITLKKESDNIRGKGHRIPLQGGFVKMSYFIFWVKIRSFEVVFVVILRRFWVKTCHLRSLWV